MRRDIAGLKVIDLETTVGPAARVVAAVLSLEIRDPGTVTIPARLADVLGDLRPAGTIDIHIVGIPAHTEPILSLIGHETDPATVRRGMGIELVDIGCIGQVYQVRAIDVDDAYLPVLTAVGLAE